MDIEKILNNNAVVTILDSGEEAVIMGNGVGFKKKIGESVDEEKIDKLFTLNNPKAFKKIKQLLENYNPQYFLITKLIVNRAERVLDKSLSDLIYVLLTEHIIFAIERYEQDISLDNPMLWEIKSLYKEEYNIGLWALDLIRQKFDIDLPSDEAGFIALHIVNASLDEEMFNTTNITILTKNILKIIKHNFKIQFEEDSLSYIRLVTHLKFFSQRILKRQQISEEDDDIYSIARNKYIKEDQCVEKIAKFIKREFNYALTSQERLYLLMHINKVIKDKCIDNV